MSCAREYPPMMVDLTITNSDIAYIWDKVWFPSTGVDAIALTADVRNVVLGTAAAMAIKPAIQFATVRSDRPDAGAAIAAGSVITAGSFAKAETLLYIAFKSCGRIFPARDFTFQPVNNTAAVSYIPLTGVFPTVAVDKAKAAVLGLDNLNATMQHRLAGRAFNDPLARGAWVNLEAGWNSPAAGDFSSNTDEVSLTGLSLSAYHWMELALGVRKSVDGDTNSRVHFHVLPAVKYL